MAKKVSKNPRNRAVLKGDFTKYMIERKNDHE